MQQPEQRLGKRIQLYCGRINWLCIRYNTGKVKDAKTGKWIDFGPPTGHSDYIVYTDDGRAIFIETKIHPRKPTQEQLDWQAEMRSRGFGAYVIYSLEEFITTVVGGKEVGK